MENAQPAIVIYSSPTCAFCHMAREYFEQKGLGYAEKDITEDRDALTFILEKVGQAVTPIITINDKVIVGFDKPKIDQALESSDEAK